MKQLFDRICDAFSTSVFLSLLGLAFLAAAPVVFGAACSSQELQRIEDASSKRAMICSAVDELASLAPSVYTTRAQQACKAGADLRVIAAAYAGCYEEEPAPSVPVDPPAAPAPEPAPAVPVEPAPPVAEGG